MTDYTASLISVPNLTQAEAEGMLALYESMYVLPDQDFFREDLAGKQEVLLLHSGSSLVGFTTLQVYDFVLEGSPRRIVFSGDTVVHRDHWGQQVLARRWISRVGELHRQDPGLPIYWFLVVKGHRTYRFLSAFCTRFHPHWERPAPELKVLADRLAVERFGEHYDAGTGLVRYPSSRGHLRSDVAEPTGRERALPEVAYFLERNPDYQEGHELVCLFEFTGSAMKPLTRRIFGGAG